MLNRNKDGEPVPTVRIQPDGRSVRLPKLGIVECRISKQVRGRILSATVSVTSSGKYFVSLNCTDEPDRTLPPTGREAGVDLGLKNAAVTSDGVTAAETSARVRGEAEEEPAAALPKNKGEQAVRETAEADSAGSRAHRKSATRCEP